ncbi:MAG: Pyrimidine biosynthesis enzyme [Thermotoga sp. 47_83]|jgi:ABC-type nitrate/sulfonate/bicarbonate transport system substrate-binding protein|uniref:NMT1/THI5 like domain protein n=2 Tax=Thermotoga petrophila TaxID=93929 RepID=D2C5Y4_THEP2|nr:ABC transporter substrate-binding protein [Thermotoga petrophila]KUK32922.1 MAG: Pyrimidine biosynthesis enzyme [Thermotoga sp. 47_83]MDK2898595.1 NitT/TauT family transport system substrate-binding protein [Thermotoga sp.]ADA66370.1 NMT1/THI5 like domain protein [Thermotoga petrophila RKU-10]KUK23003.1 MAG: Pyrimidine biosynthesis enzyme [Thermotoga petrophila]HBU00508.1 ABC transporter substrate-binding protein [Thermotoga petrophila]
MKKILVLLFLIPLVLFAEEVTVVLDWYPNTNHTGLYVAKDLGYYEEEGLNVEIVQPSRLTAEQIVASGKAEFGVSYQEAVTLARGEGLPIVSIAAVIQHNTSGFAWLKSEGIKSVKDWEGKKYGTWGSPIERATIEYIMKKYGADPSKVIFVNVGQMDFFAGTLNDVFDFAWIFYGWDGVASKVKGIEIEFLPLREIDEVFDYYTPVLITSESLIEKNPDLVRRFLKATAKGYEYAIQHPVGAAKILLKYAPELDEKIVVESQKYLAGQYKADAEKWGYQKEEVWRRYAEWLHSTGFLKEMIDVTKAFTNEFLP